MKLTARTTIAALCVAARCLGAPAMAAQADVAQPEMHRGDAWIFDKTVNKGQSSSGRLRLDVAVMQVEGDKMIVGLKRDDLLNPLDPHALGLDWSKLQTIGGATVVTARPFAFPLQVGKTWTVEYSDGARHGAMTSLHVQRHYSVNGWEDVKVAAGTFHALKVHSQGLDEATIEVPADHDKAGGDKAGGDKAGGDKRGGDKTGEGKPAATQVVTTRTSADLYYVPEVKNYVKSVEERFAADDTRTFRTTMTLVAFRLKK